MAAAPPSRGNATAIFLTNLLTQLFFLFSGSWDRWFAWRRRCWRWETMAEIATGLETFSGIKVLYMGVCWWCLLKK